MNAAAVFRALGDPVRLAMMQRLARREPCTIADVSAGFGVTRQGARKHLQVLVDAHLVVLEPQGREVQVLMDRRALDEIGTFIERIGQRWDRRLEALKRGLEAE